MKFSDIRASVSSRFKNTVALRHNVYAIIISVVFIAAVIGCTVLSTFLADRYPVDIDLTTGKIHSMTEENADFIKGVDKEVNVYVCQPEAVYDCTVESNYNMCYYAARDYFVDYNLDNASYFKQTVELLKKYENLNGKIKVSFLDLTQPSANEIADDFDDLQWYESDILVDCWHDYNGDGEKDDDEVRRTYIPFSDVYTLEENEQTKMYASYYQYGMGNYALAGQHIGYDITENKIESCVSSAIYKVVSDKTPVFVAPISYFYSDEEIIEAALKTTLTSNNFKVEYSDDLLCNMLSPETYEKYDGIILANMATDISELDRTALEAFLDNGGKKGKSLFYYAGTNTHKFTNLCALLGDWGIGYGDGIVYDSKNCLTDSGVPTYTSLIMTSLKTDYTKYADSKFTRYAATDLLPMKQIYDNNTTATYDRHTEVLAYTGSNGTATVMPVTEDKTQWTPGDDADYDAFPAVILSEDQAVIGGTDFVSSYVVAFASDDILNPGWNSYIYGNLTMNLDIYNYTSGISSTPVNFAAKAINTETFIATEKAVNTVKIIFMAVIPLLTIVAGIAVWIWRRTR